MLALAVAQAGSATLAATLDLDPVLWSFLDHLDIGSGEVLGGSLGQLAKATQDPVAKRKLDKILKTLPQFDDAQPENAAAVSAARTQRQQDARAELDAHIAGDMPTTAILDATARAGGISGLPTKEIAAKLRGQPASVVLQYVIASTMESRAAMAMLLASPDVAADHVMALVYSYSMTHSRIAILADDRLRKRVRNVVGRATPFLERQHAPPQDGALGFPGWRDLDLHRGAGAGRRPHAV